MSIHGDFQFQINATASCPTIEVEDMSTYPWNGYARTDLAFALFWNNGTNYYGDLSDPTLGVWNITFNANGIWDISMFMVRRITNGLGITMNSGNIMYYTNDGNFYQCVTYQYGGITNWPTGVSDNYWQLLTTADYNIFYNNWNGDDDLLWGFTSNQYAVNCDELISSEDDYAARNVLLTSCHSYRVVNPFENPSEDVVVIVWNINMTEQISCTIIDINAGETYADITTPDDGVYIVQIGLLDTSGPARVCAINYDEQYYEYPIYDFCNALTCYNSMIQSILCNEIDPCCRNCDPEFLEQRQIFREELNKMNALMFYLYGLLNYDNTVFESFTLVYQMEFEEGHIVYEPFNTDRNIIIERIQDIIDKLADITGRCGDCNGPRDDLSTSPCIDC